MIKNMENNINKIVIYIKGYDFIVDTGQLIRSFSPI